MTDRVPDEIDDNRLGLPTTPLFGLFPSDLTTRQVRPATLVQALMENAPGDPQVASFEEAGPITEIVRFAQRAMSAQDAFVIDAIDYEGVTYKELAERLGLSITHTHRLHEKAIDTLRYHLLNSDTVREQVGLAPNWESACLTELVNIAGYEDGWPDSVVYDLGDAINAICDAIEDGVDDVLAHRENDAMEAFTLAAEEAILFLRSINRWKLTRHHQLMFHHYRTINPMGMYGVAVRLNDMQAGLRHLQKNGARPRNDSVLDTLVDVIAHAAIARMLKAETFELPTGISQ